MVTCAAEVPQRTAQPWARIAGMPRRGKGTLLEQKMQQKPTAAAVRSTAQELPRPKSEAEKAGDQTNRYAKSSSGLERVAGRAPALSGAELKVLLHLATLTENLPEHTVRISQREIADATKVSRSNVALAIEKLIRLRDVTWTKGTATEPSRFTVNLFSTVFMGGPKIGPPPAQVDLFQDHPSPKGWSQNRTTVDLIQDQGGPVLGPPSAENAPLAAATARVDFDLDFKSLIDRLLSAKPQNQNPTEMAEARKWLWGYASKLGLDPNPHPPPDTIVAQFLSVAPWPQLLQLFYDLMAERKVPGENYTAWFVAVAMQRIHGVKPELLRQARAEFKIVRKQRGELPDPEHARELLDQVNAPGWQTTRKAKP